MNHSKLPTRLKKEPLVEAIFDVRFDSSVDAADILPGYLHAKFGPSVRMTRLPASELPKMIREQDPNLAFQPLIHLEHEQFAYLVGSKSLGVACRLPYPGWEKFKAAIIEALGHLNNSKIAARINRYSLKYVDILGGESLAADIARIDLDLRVGKRLLKDTGFQINMAVNETNGLVHLVHIGAPARIEFAQGLPTRNGLVVSIDTIDQNLTLTCDELLNAAEQKLSNIHQLNKAMFFECLKPTTVEYLEPSYD